MPKTNKMRRDVDPEETYQFLGPLTVHEVRWLGVMSRSWRMHWLHTIYGSATLKYATAQYNALRIELEKEALNEPTSTRA